MISDKENTRISKLLSLVLRHQPSLLGIELDEQGWTSVDVLLSKAQIDRPTLAYIVETNNKKRFSFNEDKTRIRANQGHSVEVELGYKAEIPPKILYHGTGSGAIASILKTGLNKRKRHHVHLSSDTETAYKVGQRHGEPVVLEIDAEQMSQNNIEFYVSANGVWLTDSVPPRYIKLP
ncbi:RNA 2'-phosphotransferase [Spirosoma sp. HMF3257]|uniref:Probable RNA 2'-phosphotransferase n=1 Tax=Spirosoma telluris TaxID=2183553 RepID=A0A327NSG1_9BACT|nr:RNA 2'-phosphotransferase [Spirosoma telluris]RAI77675.1 RNA 2'-phosphotransferase [Spirosoma telluris]